MSGSKTQIELAARQYADRTQLMSNHVYDWQSCYDAYVQGVADAANICTKPSIDCDDGLTYVICPDCKTKDTQVICCTCGHGDDIDEFRQTES